MINKIKNWILNRQFVKDYYQAVGSKLFKDAEELIYRKAFTDARKDLEETNIYDVDTKADVLSNTKLNNLLSVVDVNKIVTLDKARGIIFVGGVRLEEGRLANLKAEAEFFLESDLWHLIYETPKELAQRAMFVTGETLVDMQKGKSMLYTLSTQKNIVETFKGYIMKPKPPTPPAPTP